MEQSWREKEREELAPMILFILKFEITEIKSKQNKTKPKQNKNKTEEGTQTSELLKHHITLRKH